MSESRVLLVEGVDDKHVVLHLCQRSGINLPFCVLDKGNIENLLKSIKMEINVHDRKAIGILVDANDNRNSRWQAVINRLREQGIEPPNLPISAGTIIEGNPDIDRPRIGIWLMPDKSIARRT